MMVSMRREKEGERDWENGRMVRVWAVVHAEECKEYRSSEKSLWRTLYSDGRGTTCTCIPCTEISGEIPNMDYRDMVHCMHRRLCCHKYPYASEFLKLQLSSYGREARKEERSCTCSTCCILNRLHVIHDVLNRLHVIQKSACREHKMFDNINKSRNGNDGERGRHDLTSLVQ